MGTRADFYIGRGKDAEWLGSIGWDGHPCSVVRDNAKEEGIGLATNADEFRAEVLAFLASREDATLPKDGWPWPWDDSRTTDFSYAFDGELFISCFGRPWITKAEEKRRAVLSDIADGADDDKEAVAQAELDKIEEDEQAAGEVAFPDMTDIKNVTFGHRSGAIFIRG